MEKVSKNTSHEVVKGVNQNRIYLIKVFFMSNVITVNGMEPHLRFGQREENGAKHTHLKMGMTNLTNANCMERQSLESIKHSNFLHLRGAK
jgi:hypothetical protein